MSYNINLPETLPFEPRYLNLASAMRTSEIKELLSNSVDNLNESLKADEIHERDLAMVELYIQMLKDKLDLETFSYKKKYMEEVNER
jgi:hypothetical protein